MHDEPNSLARRIVTTFLIVFVVLLLVSLVGFCSGRWEDADAQQGAPDLYSTGIELDATLLRLDKLALDDAYHQTLLKYWSVWLASGAQDATAFTAGLRNARRAYAIAVTQIARREQVLLEAQGQRRPAEPK